MSTNATVLSGRLVLDDRVEDGRVTVADGWITAVEPGAATASDGGPAPYLAPGFVDVHVHGGGGHDAMGGRAALDGMARHLLRHGVTSFLPTGGHGAARRPVPLRRRRSATGCRSPRPTGRSRSGSTSKGRCWPHARKRRPRPRAPAGRRPTPRSRRPGAARRRPAAGDRSHRNCPGRSTSSRWLREPRRGGLDGPLGGHHRRGPRRLRGGRHLDDAPVQRDERGRPSRPGPRGRGARPTTPPTPS